MIVSLELIFCFIVEASTEWVYVTEQQIWYETVAETGILNFADDWPCFSLTVSVCVRASSQGAK